MRIKLCTVLADERDPLIGAARDYLKKAGRRYDAGLVVVPPSKRKKGAEDAKVRDEEGERLLTASAGCLRVALDVGGEALSSEALSSILEELLARGRPIALLVGGATGLSPSVQAAAERTWSLSRLTLPHKLAVLVAAEQVFRAHEIARGGPYHK